MIDARSKFRAVLSHFCEWIEKWLTDKPDRDLLQLAHAQIGRIYSKIGKELKVK